MIVFALLFIVITYCGLAVTRRIWYLDTPWKDTKRSYRVPTAQWFVLVIAILILFALTPWFLTNNLIYPYLISISILGVVSTIDTLWDDIKWIPWIHPWIRLAIQVWLASYIYSLWLIDIFPLSIWTLTIPDIPLLSYIFIVWWFILFINAINWFDGISWLASGISSIWFLTIILLLSLTVFPIYFDDFTVSRLIDISSIYFATVILFIAAICYTCIETPPIGLLRDIGVTFFWFSLAYFSLVWWAKIGTILVSMSLVIFDALWVFYYRIFIKKKSPLHKDYSHLHYRLLALGRQRWQIRSFIWGVSLLMMVLIIAQWWNSLNKYIIIAALFIIFYWTHIYLYHIKKLPMEYTP